MDAHQFHWLAINYVFGAEKVERICNAFTTVHRRDGHSSHFAPTHDSHRSVFSISVPVRKGMLRMVRVRVFLYWNVFYDCILLTINTKHNNFQIERCYTSNYIGYRRSILLATTQFVFVRLVVLCAPVSLPSFAHPICRNSFSSSHKWNPNAKAIFHSESNHK